MARIERALARLRMRAVASEYELHEKIGAALSEGGFTVRHEVMISPRCRIDFVVGRVGLEIKRGRPQRSRLVEQAGRYLASNEIDGLILIVEKNITLPDTIQKKPVRVVGLQKLWGVALP